MVSFLVRSLHSRGKNHWHPFIKKLDVLESLSGSRDEESSIYSCSESNLVPPVYGHSLYLLTYLLTYLLVYSLCCCNSVVKLPNKQKETIIYASIHRLKKSSHAKFISDNVALFHSSLSAHCSRCAK